MLLGCFHMKAPFQNPDLILDPLVLLTEHADTASLKETRHDVCVLSASHCEVPVSVVDLDVPVTTIDEVFVEDSCTNTPDHASEIREKSFVWSEVAETKGTKTQAETADCSSSF